MEKLPMISDTVDVPTAFWNWQIKSESIVKHLRIDCYLTENSSFARRRNNYLGRIFTGGG